MPRSGLYSRIPEAPLLRFLMQFCITLVVIGPPCMLMGGTLPLLIRQLTARDGSARPGHRLAVCDQHLRRGPGLLPDRISFAAGARTAVRPTTWPPRSTSPSARFRLRGQRLLQARCRHAQGPGRRCRRAAMASGRTGTAWPGCTSPTALTGCAALVLEMTWTRQLALILGGSTYAFTATLFVVLVGIALGSLIFHWWLQRRRASPGGWPMVVIGVSGVTTAGGQVVAALAAMAGGAGERARSAGRTHFGTGHLRRRQRLARIPAGGRMGVLFPLFVHMTHASAARVGRRGGQYLRLEHAGIDRRRQPDRAVAVSQRLARPARWRWRSGCTSWRCWP